jgi:hypothetical protein
LPSHYVRRTLQDTRNVFLVANVLAGTGAGLRTLNGD